MTIFKPMLKISLPNLIEFSGSWCFVGFHFHLLFYVSSFPGWCLQNLTIRSQKLKTQHELHFNNICFNLWAVHLDQAFSQKHGSFGSSLFWLIYGGCKRIVYFLTLSKIRTNWKLQETTNTCYRLANNNDQTCR